MYQINVSSNQSQSFSNKSVFNKMYRAIVLCYCVSILKYPKLRMVPFKRIADLLNFIKIKNISVEFNIFTIVAYIGKIMSNLVNDAEERR